MKMQCLLCEEKLEKDKDWYARKKAHETRHSMGREDGVNNIKGKVVWVTVW